MQQRMKLRRPARRLVRWASVPYQGKLGEYIGVSLDAGCLRVAVRSGAMAPRWVDAAEALTEMEAAAWARSGFKRGRQRG